MNNDKATVRPSVDEYFLLLAQTASIRSTCRHRHQGAILVHDKCIVSAGYNGSPPGAPHCDELGRCVKDEGLACMAEGLHGESNAIVFAAKAGISTRRATLYSVYSPCSVCCNLIATAGITRVVYAVEYSTWPHGEEYLKKLGIEVRQVTWTSTDS